MVREDKQKVEVRNGKEDRSSELNLKVEREESGELGWEMERKH